MSKKNMDTVQTRSLATKVFRYFKDPSVAVWRKLAGVAAAVYVVSPVDLIPDVIPVIGWLDDLGVLTAAALFMLREVQKHSSRTSGLPRLDRDDLK